MEHMLKLEIDKEDFYTFYEEYRTMEKLDEYFTIESWLLIHDAKRVFTVSYYGTYDIVETTYDTFIEAIDYLFNIIKNHDYFNDFIEWTIEKKISQLVDDALSKLEDFIKESKEEIDQKMKDFKYEDTDSVHQTDKEKH